MTFATATIQGYVTYIKSGITPETKRTYTNMLVVVPDKKNKDENGMRKSNTYKVTVWDNQALSAAQYIATPEKPEENEPPAVYQMVTVSGQLSIDEYSVSEHDKDKIKNVMNRLDFASILDYGTTLSEKRMENSVREMNTAQEFIKRKTAAK